MRLVYTLLGRIVDVDLAEKNDNFSAKALQAGRIPIVNKPPFLGTNTPHMKPLQASSTFNHSTSWCPA